MTDRRGPGTKKPRLEAESIVYWKAQAERHRAEVERLTSHIRNTGIDDLEACLSVADGKCARLEAELDSLKAQLATEREAHARTVAALEECLDALDFDNGERPEHACQARGRAAIAAAKVTP